jgi:hypothetical protein
MAPEADAVYDADAVAATDGLFTGPGSEPRSSG